ncbi:MAG: beta-lactamase family protein [Alphaproteobacteria bacterium]|nr:beta-lactamase family protein [Alphaproteobacteria bacterium]
MTAAVARAPSATQPAIHGDCDPAFAPVRRAFAENFASGEEVGAAVAVWRGERLCVDLWGGHADAAGRPWQRDTMVSMMSVAKGVLALCAHRLVERGALDLDAPVARTWPEFAAAGKGGVLVRHLLDHSAGLSAVDGPLPEGAACDWAFMTDALARTAPAAPPGVQRAYHPITMGWLVGEVIRRVTGMTVGRMLATEIAAPYGIDYHIGVADADLPRCADTLGDFAQTIFNGANDGSLGARALAMLPHTLLNTPAYRRAELPSVNGIGTARAIAKLYGLLAQPGGSPLLGAAALARATTLQWEGPEATMGQRRRMALGFILGDPPHVPLGPNPRSFGHTGAGGALGFADPDAGIGFAYAPNRMHVGSPISPRLQRLVDALYVALR